jgi:hypothetical protein
MSSDVLIMEATCLRILERALAQTPSHFQFLRRDSLGNLYKYLAIKALSGQPGRQRGSQAFRFIRNAVRNDPSLLWKPALLKASIVAGLMVLVPFPDMVRQIACLCNVQSLGYHMKQKPR